MKAGRKRNSKQVAPTRAERQQILSQLKEQALAGDSMAALALAAFLGQLRPNEQRTIEPNH